MTANMVLVSHRWTQIMFLASNKEAEKLHTVKPLPIQPPKDIAWWSFSSGSYSAYGVFQDSLTMLLRYKFDILEF